MTSEKTTTDVVHPDLREIAELAPFQVEELSGERFARGNMLGGANPLDASHEAPWKRDAQQ